MPKRIGDVMTAYDEAGRAAGSESIMHDADMINGYLADAPSTFLQKRSSPICHVPRMVRGGGVGDWGFFTLTTKEVEDIVAKEPEARRWIRPFSMGAEFIKGIPRYCLWMKDIEPSDLRSLPIVSQRVEEVRRMREQSPRASTRKHAETPWLFDEDSVPKGNFIAIPQVSSGRREYIPMGFVTNGLIPGNKLFFVDDAGLFEFGILESQFHNAWMRAVAGRLKSDYQYSNTIVYNNFVWPSPSESQREDIERCAQAVLDARASHQGQSLADLYDAKYMPTDLRRAHHALDRAVEAAYGVDFNGDEDKIVAHLFELYAEKTKGE